MAEETMVLIRETGSEIGRCIPLRKGVGWAWKPVNGKQRPARMTADGCIPQWVWKFAEELLPLSELKEREAADAWAKHAGWSRS